MHRLHRLIRLLVVPVALVALLAAAGPAQAAPGDWWQFGYTGANTRYNPNETAIGAANVARLVVGAEQVPTFGAGATFAHASGAWRLAEGAQRWRSGAIPYGSPSVSGGRVYATGVRFADDRSAVVVDQFRLGTT